MKKIKFAMLAVFALFAFSCSSAGSGAAGGAIKITSASEYDSKVGSSTGVVFFMASKTDCFNCTQMKAEVLPALASEVNVKVYYGESMGPNADLDSIHNSKIFMAAYQAGIVESGKPYDTPLIIIFKDGKAVGGATGRKTKDELKALIAQYNN